MPESVRCAQCGESIDPGAAQCPHCGAPRAEAAVQSARTGPGPGGGGNAAAFRPGQVIANRYTVIQLIGRGGMGAIYKVRDNVLKDEVALKTLLPQFLQDKLVVERFYNEARIARQLSHPNVVRVHDIGMANGVLYISMEFLPGESLRMIMDRPGRKGPLTIDQIVHIFGQLCAALEYAHAYTVHRDIKPENVMVAGDGSVKLMDFGISKLMTQTRLTQASVVMGTPHYMSPEQYKNSSAVDRRADIFSLGVMLYEVLTGNLPAGVSRPPSQARDDVPPRLDQVVSTCLEPDPKARYQTASELRRALAEVQKPDFVPAPQVRAPRVAGPWLRRGAALLAMAALLGGGYLGVAALEHRRHAGGAQAQGAAEAEAGRDGAQVLLGALTGDAGALEAAAPLITRLWPRAAEQAGEHPARQAALDRGRRAWERYQDEPAATDAGMAAAQCLAAALVWPEDRDVVFIPPGEVLLGDGTVFVDGFFIDRYEVTQEAYRDFLQNEGTAVPPAPPAWSESDAGQTPAYGVTFADATAYAAARNALLPTEPQWARAAYGEDGAPRPFPWGDEWREDGANLAAGRPAPVGEFGDDLTVYGCRDMAGNVSEWTRSAAGSLPYEPGDHRDEIGKEPFGIAVIVRGGNYMLARSASPAKTEPLSRRRALYADYPRSEPGLERVGFRCVRPLKLQMRAAASAREAK